jgi:aminomethyltransferase
VQKDFEWFEKAKNEFGFDAVITNNSDAYAKIDVQGPNSQEILQKISDKDLSEISFYTFFECKLNEIPAIVSRSGYTGEDGFELYFPAQEAIGLWKKLLELGAIPAGLGARDTLRLEAGMNLYGHEMNKNVSPLECRYGWVTSLEKDFIGAEALRKQKKAGVGRKLIGIEMIERAIARNPYPVLSIQNEKIGEVTSGTFSPTLKKNIALCLIKTEFSETGTELLIEIREKKLKAKVVKLPFYRKGGNE